MLQISIQMSWIAARKRVWMEEGMIWIWHTIRQVFLPRKQGDGGEECDEQAYQQEQTAKKYSMHIHGGNFVR